MKILTTLAVFADLCTVYTTFKSEKRKPVDNRCIIDFIKTLDIFKETHNNAQHLLEYCRSWITEPLDPSSTNAKTFKSRLTQLDDCLRPFINNSDQYEYETYLSPKEIKENSNLEIERFSKELRRVCDSVTNMIRGNIIDLKSEAIKVGNWTKEWRETKFAPETDVNKYKGFIHGLEHPTRLILLGANMAIMDSITILRFIGGELL